MDGFILNEFDESIIKEEIEEEFDESLPKEHNNESIVIEEIYQSFIKDEFDESILKVEINETINVHLDIKPTAQGNTNTSVFNELEGVLNSIGQEKFPLVLS